MSLGFKSEGCRSIVFGYLCHDELWASDENPEIASMHCELPYSLGEFYLRAATSEDFPVELL